MTSLPAPNRTPATDVPAIPTSPFSEPWLSSLRRRLVWVSGRPAMAGEVAITTHQAEGIASAISTLQRQTIAGPVDREAVGVEVAKLIAAFPVQDASVSARVRIGAFSDALGDAPAWAVQTARLRVLRGETALGARFCPTPAEFAGVVRDVVRPLKQDLADLISLSRAKPLALPDEAGRERIAAGLDALGAELRGDAQAKAAARRESVRETLAKGNDAAFRRACEEAGVDPAGGVSPALLETLDRLRTPSTGEPA